MPEIQKYTKLRITGTEYSKRISDANLLDPGFVDLHFLLRSGGKRINTGGLDSARGSDSPILSVCGHSAKPLKDPHSGLHSPKDCVLVVKERCRSKREEELGT